MHYAAESQNIEPLSLMMPPFIALLIVSLLSLNGLTCWPQIRVEDAFLRLHVCGMPLLRIFIIYIVYAIAITPHYIDDIGWYSFICIIVYYLLITPFRCHYFAIWFYCCHAFRYFRCHYWYFTWLLAIFLYSIFHFELPLLPLDELAEDAATTFIFISFHFLWYLFHYATLRFLIAFDYFLWCRLFSLMLMLWAGMITLRWCYCHDAAADDEAHGYIDVISILYLWLHLLILLLFIYWWWCFDLAQAFFFYISATPFIFAAFRYAAAAPFTFSVAQENSRHD